MGLSEFIKKNKEFWQGHINENCDKKLLIEEIDLPIILHDLAIHSTLLNKAKGYQPIWLPNDNVSLELLKSYVPSAEKAKIVKLGGVELIKAFFCALGQFFKVLITRNILSIKYDGVKYGDIVYDVYLIRKQVGTIKNIDYLIFELALKCIKRHMFTIKSIKANNISAILVSHRIGIISGVMLRAALKHGCDVYSLAGMHRATLTKTSDLKDMNQYQYTPTRADINSLTSLPQEKFNKLYEFVNDFHLNGNCNMDAKYAFSENNKLYKDKESFAKDYNLDPNKKNIFVMLHAFTDHPHSHFKWMIFKDYGDWFLETLDFAKKDKNVNWIFKQHPSDKFYPTKDIKFEELFKNIPSNIVFLSDTNKLDTRSIINIGDSIITCLGSAGFEVPAMSGIPSITAGDNHYHGFGFSKNPKTRKEYFDILNKFKNVEKLTIEEQNLAKAVYMFIYYFCTVDFTAMPVLTMDEHHKANMNDWYWDRVLKLYETNGNKILDELNDYAKEVAKDSFVALRSSIQELNKKGII